VSSRRQVLAAAPILAAIACARGAAKPTVRVPLRALEAGRRVTVVLGDVPVEVRRDDSGRVRARSLLCTHMGCDVAWDGGEARYVCPCHGGRFDAEGRVVSGSPTRPLPELPARLEGEDVIVGG
jgi:Rieske Fe-S protein